MNPCRIWWLVACLWWVPLFSQVDDRFADQLTLADGRQLRVDLRKLPPADLARAVSFVHPDGQAETLSPSEVAGFSFNKTGREYQSVAVDLPAPPGPASHTPRLRFGEVLVKGDVELLKVALATGEYNELAADSEPYLYLLREGDMELVLRLSSIMVYERLHANPARFRNLLKFLTRDCLRAQALARKARFADADILRVLEAYGDCDQNRKVVMDRDRLRGGWRLAHDIRLLHLDIRDADFSDQQLSAGLGYQAEVRFTESYRRLAVLASLDLVYHSFRWEKISDVSQSMVRGNLSLGYSPLESRNLSVQLTAGLSNYNAFASGFRSFFSNNYFLLNGGANLRSGKFLFGIHYESLPGQISRRPSNQLVTSLGYRVVL